MHFVTVVKSLLLFILLEIVASTEIPIAIEADSFPDPYDAKRRKENQSYKERSYENCFPEMIVNIFTTSD